MRVIIERLILPMTVAGALLSGCGGSHGNSPVPVVNAGTDQTVNANTQVALQGQFSDKSGTLGGSVWNQVSGPSVNLSAQARQSRSISFTAPVVSRPTVLTFTLTVFDEDGLSATDTVNVTVDPAVMLKGKVTDGPIAGATVTVTVGSQTYTTTAAADGTYSINIGAVDPSAFVTITATGGSGQGNVKLVSFAGTAGALLTASGSNGTLDGTVSTSDAGAVDATNLSTAEAALIMAANGGNPPSTDTQLTDLQKSVDSSALLQLATVIKLVVDDGIPLPSGVSNTLALAQSTSATNAVITEVNSSDPNLFQNTMNQVLSDAATLVGYQTGSVPSEYFINRAGCYVCANRGYRLTFNSDGTGHRYAVDAAYSSDFTWTINSSEQIEIQYDPNDPVVIGGLTCTTSIGPVGCTQTITSATITRLTAGSTVDSVAIESKGTIAYNSSSLSTTAYDGTHNFIAMSPGALTKFAAADVTGTWAVPLSYPLIPDEYVEDLLTFKADGTGVRPVDGETFTWAVDSTTGVLGIQFAGGDQLDLYGLRTDGNLGMDTMASMTTAAGKQFTMPQLLVKGVDSSLPGTLSLASIDGPQQYMDWGGLDFNVNSAAGTAQVEFYDNSTGKITFQYPVQATYNGSYFEMITWLDVNNGWANVSSCTGVTICFEQDSTKWYPLAIDNDGRLFVLEEETGWNYDSTASIANYRGTVAYGDHIIRWLWKDANPPSSVTSPYRYPLSVATQSSRGTLVRRLQSAQNPTVSLRTLRRMPTYHTLSQK